MMDWVTDDDYGFDDYTLTDEVDESSALYWCTSCCDNPAVEHGLCEDCLEEES